MAMNGPPDPVRGQEQGQDDASPRRRLRRRLLSSGE